MIFYFNSNRWVLKYYSDQYSDYWVCFKNNSTYILWTYLFSMLQWFLLVHFVRKCRYVVLQVWCTNGVSVQNLGEWGTRGVFCTKRQIRKGKSKYVPYGQNHHILAVWEYVIHPLARFIPLFSEYVQFQLMLVKIRLYDAYVCIIEFLCFPLCEFWGKFRFIYCNGFGLLVIDL